MKIIAKNQGGLPHHPDSMTIVDFEEGEHIVFSCGDPIALSFGWRDCYIRHEKPESKVQEHGKNVAHWLLHYHDINVDDYIGDDSKVKGINGIKKSDLFAVISCISFDETALLKIHKKNSKEKNEVTIDDPSHSDLIS
tara:strand:+ start:1139 stop:1552 length:414 start_codon:yes stop_codon:yes gene_type:complete